MTVSTSSNRADFTGNGVQTVFPFTFKTFAASDLQVYLFDGTTETLLTITTHYTVSLNGDQEASPGGSITMVTAPGGVETLTVLRMVEATQTLDLILGGAFSPESVERALDKLTMLAQQVDEVAARTVQVPVTSAVPPDDYLTEITTQVGLATAQAVAAAGSASQAENALADFNTMFLGPLTADPSMDNNGNALVNGALYFNVITGVLRVYSGSVWQDSAAAIPASFTADAFSGTGAQTAFTLTATPSSAQSCLVFVAGVRQRPTLDYTVSGTTLTFGSAPASGTNNVTVLTVSALAAGTPDNDSVSTVKIQASAVTTEKVADGAITSAKLDPTYEATLPKLDQPKTFTKAQRGDVVSVTDAATITLDLDTSNNFAVTLNVAGATRALGNPTNVVEGQSGVIIVTQDATGSRALTFGSNWDFAGGTAPSLTSTANAIDILSYFVLPSGKIFITASKDVK